jgi:hypothetical protein
MRALGWHRTIEEARGQSNIPNDVARLLHKATRLLSHLGQYGASVPTATTPWSTERLADAV